MPSSIRPPTHAYIHMYTHTPVPAMFLGDASASDAQGSPFDTLDQQQPIHARGTSTSPRLTDEQWRRERQPASQPADPAQVCERRIINNTARPATAVGKTRSLHCSLCSLAWLAGDWPRRRGAQRSNRMAVRSSSSACSGTAAALVVPNAMNAWQRRLGGRLFCFCKARLSRAMMLPDAADRTYHCLCK